MRRSFCIIALLCYALAQAVAQDVSKYVDPFIGVDGGGNIFPGPSAPFGMVKLGPDCGKKNWNAGWDRDGNIHGFSHTHLSGTGGGCKYGNILMLPLTGEIDPEDYASPREAEGASLGEYHVTLSRYGTRARLTALERSGFHEYTFPRSDSARILIDLGSFLRSAETQEFVGAEVRILSPTTVEGYSRVRGGWNIGQAYTVYFYAEFDKPASETGTWKEGKLYPGEPVQYDTGEKCGAYFGYKTAEGEVIRVRVGISYLSTGRARANLAEMDCWDFDRVRSKLVARWTDVLSSVKLQGGETDKTIFYTALYHAFLQPVDKRGENPKWVSDEPYYDDYFAIWDTFRATHPLFTLLRPSVQRDMIRSLIDIYRFDGYMPDARSGHDNGRVQGGTNCDILIADALVKGIGGIDYRTALEAMIKNADVPPGDDERKEGRGGLRDYNTIGYVSTDFERAGSRTFEYANCDFATATIAARLGHPETAEKYLKRSANWRNLWNDTVRSMGFEGFIWPRRPDGAWVSNPRQTVFTGGTWPDFLYETFPWEMSFYVPHDMASLITCCGGPETFTKRLDTYFTYERWDQRWYIGLFQISNEPGFLVPVLYNYVNRPDKTAEITRKALGTKYNTSRSGLPGNDDSGSMSAWYIFHAMGFYPNAGQDVYLISSPIFEKVEITLENGRKFTVTAAHASPRNIYVQSAKLNGKPLDRCWFRHIDIANGGTLEFVMGPEPSGWARNGTLPPSGTF